MKQLFYHLSRCPKGRSSDSVCDSEFVSRLNLDSDTQGLTQKCFDVEGDTFSKC